MAQAPQPSVKLLDQQWFRALLFWAMNAAITLALTSATLTWKARDFADAVKADAVKEIREDLPRYLTREEFLTKEVEKTERLNERLQKILEKLD